MTTSHDYRREPVGAQISTGREEATPIVRRQRPPAGVLGAAQWSWTVSDATELTGIRRDVRGRMADVPVPPAAAAAPLLAAPVERLLLVVSELTTNGLRHGTPPVTMTVTRVPQGWLVIVSDDQDEAFPAKHVPDPRRPGQHGLIVVAAVSDAAGWYTEPGSKHVWATVPDVAPAAMLGRLGAD